MYFATNIEEIQNAIEANAPRPIKDVLLETYPDCTIDRNNRAHAPYDGYECPYTGKLFRAGEYLPFEFSEDQVIMKGGSPSRALWVYCEGEIYSLEGTKAQIRSGAEIAKNQTAIFDASANHVGEVKKRQDFTLRLLAIFTDAGIYGLEHTHLMRDEENNPVVYKGTKKLPCKEGEVINITATVKSHWVSKYDGRKGTYINRPKVK